MIATVFHRKNSQAFLLFGDYNIQFCLVSIKTIHLRGKLQIRNVKKIDRESSVRILTNDLWIRVSHLDN